MLQEGLFECTGGHVRMFKYVWIFIPCIWTHLRGYRSIHAATYWGEVFSLLHYKRTVNIQFLGNEMISEGICASLGWFLCYLVSHLKQSAHPQLPYVVKAQLRSLSSLSALALSAKWGACRGWYSWDSLYQVGIRSVGSCGAVLKLAERCLLQSNPKFCYLEDERLKLLKLAL